MKSTVGNILKNEKSLFLSIKNKLYKTLTKQKFENVIWYVKFHSENASFSIIYLLYIAQVFNYPEFWTIQTFFATPVSR